MDRKNEKTEIKRVKPDPKTGLNDLQVNERLHTGHYNKESSLPTKSYGRIVRDNVCTLFNLINIVLAAAVLYVGSYKNMLFMGVVLCNIAIGIFQEVRAKRTVDRLSIISASKVKAIRSGCVREVDVNEIVLDDVLELQNGNQVPTDCIVLEGACDVNESLLTGESDAIHKKPGDALLSGSFLVSGKCRACAEHVGDDNYASTVFSGAKYIKKVNSEIMRTLNKIIKIISIVIIPVAALLFFNQLDIAGTNFQSVVVNTVAAVIGMIPEGLILLTSTVLAVGVVRLAKHKVLVQELYCIETLARVDVLCLDKTGTITEGRMELKEVVPVGESGREEIDRALQALTCALEDNNPTFEAIKGKYPAESELKATETVSFSSDKKWSGAAFGKQGAYVIGAAEFIFREIPEKVKAGLAEYSAGYRVLVLSHAENGFRENGGLPDGLVPMALLVIKDVIRKDARKTLDYFEKQGVELKIISGDNVQTVSGIAKEAGLKNYNNFIDAATLKTPEEMKAAAEEYSIFGRVTPTQKKDLICALKEAGHTVAMTGDGVNDVLALKEADCSVAMASGTDAARNVSQLVLLNSDFSSMPKVVAEGRRSINNIQRSASLFLVKTIYSSILAILFVFLDFKYPFEPIQMTLLSAFTIGLPSFVLALEPNSDRIKGNFFINVLSKSIPAALTVILNIVFVMIATYVFGLNHLQSSTIAVLLTGFTGLMLLFKISIPFNAIRTALFAVCTGGTVLGLTVFREIFSVNPFDWEVMAVFLVLAGVSILLFLGFLKIMDVLKMEKHVKLKL